MTDHPPTLARVLADMAEVVEELCDPHRHTEPIYDRDVHRNRRLRRLHITTQPGLLAQLGEATAAATAGGDGPGGRRPVPGSRPPGCFEAMARHTAITLAAFGWCWNMRVEQRDSVEANIHALLGEAARWDVPTAQRLLGDVRRWRHQAAVMTGWASPTFAPDVPCPVCGKVGSLRINTDRKMAMCTNPAVDETGAPRCAATWDPDTIGVLADCIRAQTDPDYQGRRPPIRSGRQGHGAWLADHPDQPNGQSPRVR